MSKTLQIKSDFSLDLYMPKNVSKNTTCTYMQAILGYL